MRAAVRCERHLTAYALPDPTVPLDGTPLHRKGSAAAASAAAASAAAYYECASPPMHVGTLWLNRTRERNHMTPELLADFSRAVGQRTASRC